MKHAIITGSFDPITAGHMDIIERAAHMFDEVTVVILANTEKKSGLFTPDERLELVNLALSSLEQKNISNVSATVHGGLTSEIARDLGAGFIVRGARNGTDFDYEYNLSLIMKRFDARLETVILPASPAATAISSTYVRDLLKFGCDLGDAVPETCRTRMTEIYKGK